MIFPWKMRGSKGAHGERGPQGIKGDAGATGSIGPKGDKGDRGDVGPQGLRGIQGEPGATGATGPQGPSGISKRIELYTGTTDAGGLFTVTYSAPFPAIPNVQPEPPLLSNQMWVKVSSTANGFQLRLVQRASLTVLTLEVLAAAVTNVAGASARVLVVES